MSILVAGFKNPAALQATAADLLKLGRYADAAESYDRALSIQPNFGEANTNKSHALLELERIGTQAAETFPETGYHA